MANRWGNNGNSGRPKWLQNHCSHEIKRRLLLGRKAMTSLVSILKSRDRTIKKPECWKIDAFELWYWIRLLRVPWTARRSNQSILKEISPEYSLDGLMLKLNLQCFGHLMLRVDSFKKTLMLQKIEGGRRRGRQRMRWLDGITDSMDVSLSEELVDEQGGLACCDSWGRKESNTTERLNWNWTDWL